MKQTCHRLAKKSPADAQSSKILEAECLHIREFISTQYGEERKIICYVEIYFHGGRYFMGGEGGRVVPLFYGSNTLVSQSLYVFQ